MDAIRICNRIVQQAYRNKILFILAIVPIVAFGISVLISLPGSRIIHIGVIDEDQTPLSEAFIYMIDQGESFRLHVLDDEEEMLDSMRNLDISIGMKINNGFYENLGTMGSIELFQTHDIETFLLVELYLNSSLDNVAFLERFADNEEMLVEELYRFIAYDYVASDILENERLRGLFSATAFGFLMMFMLLVSVLSSKLIADDRFTRTIRRIFLAPVSKISYVLACFLSNFIFQMIQLTIIVLISSITGFAFTVPPHAVIILFVAFSVFASFFGLWIGFVSNSANQMIITAQMFILPGTLLSGTFFDFGIMPLWLQNIAFFFPQTWITQAARHYDGSFLNVYFASMFGYFALLCLIITIYLLVIFKKRKVASFY